MAGDGVLVPIPGQCAATPGRRRRLGPESRNPGRIRRLKFVFSPQAWKDYLHWHAARRTVLKQINKLIAHPGIVAGTCRTPL
ncbi:type II toxin-antitoxin system YoeB family toxin [Mycobacterium sp. 663a-19]|nr:type II toxin-antitoxin system YoeB family toxin [Mycobacterium sp. 663a-19]